MEVVIYCNGTKYDDIYLSRVARKMFFLPLYIKGSKAPK
jgi:hypothetical protein